MDKKNLRREIDDSARVEIRELLKNMHKNDRNSIIV
jgi:hypothetical protein